MHETIRLYTLIQGLRNFFLAENAKSLAKAWAQLQESPLFLQMEQAGRQALFPVSTDLKRADSQSDAEGECKIDWNAVEFAYNRIFVGPAAPAAPPYSSIWIRRQGDPPLLMTEQTLALRSIYHQLGFQVPHEGRIPDDHLAFELDALLISLCLDNSQELISCLPHTATEKITADYRGRQPEQNFSEMLWNHLALWVPQFCRTALAAGSVPPVIAKTLYVLFYLIHQETCTAEQFLVAATTTGVPCHE